MPDQEKTDGVFPDWVMLDRTGRTKLYDDGDPTRDARTKAVDPTAVGIDTSSGRSGYFSFTLAAPPRVSYLNLYWPRGQTKPSAFPIDPVYPSVLAADKNLVLLRIVIPATPWYNQLPHDLFVYTAAGPRPSLKQLPLHNVPAPKPEGFREFFGSKLDAGILQLAGDQGHYVVADLFVSDGDDKSVQLCVFFSASKTRNPWRVFPSIAPQPSDGGRFPVCWLTSTVLPFDGRFLCWVDYYSGLLLSDFSGAEAPVLRFVPFPGEQYTDEVIRSSQTRCCPDRFRSVSISQGKIRFVHVDNSFNKRNVHHMDNDDTDDDDDTGPDSEISIWTLNVAEFKWEIHRQLALDKIWEQPVYQQEGILPRRLPEFPVISVDNPDLVWCLLRQEEFGGKTWMAEVDVERAELRTCTPYVNEQPYCGQYMELKNSFADKSLLPAVFSKYLKNTTGTPRVSNKFATDRNRKKYKFVTSSSKKVKLSM